jgi:hypothetical protein
MSGTAGSWGYPRSRNTTECSEIQIDGGRAFENAAFLDVMIAEDAAPVVGEYLSLPLEERRAWLEQGKKGK